jgi:hypothetical protein
LFNATEALPEAVVANPKATAAAEDAVFDLPIAVPLSPVAWFSCPIPTL